MAHFSFPSLYLQLVFDVITEVLSICKIIYKMAINAKSNKESCQQIASRVKALEELVHKVQQRGPARISDTVYNALRELCVSLNSAEEVMTKFSQTNVFVKFVMSSSHRDEFSKVDKALTDNLLVLSGALLIEQGDVLHKVYDTVHKKRRPRIYAARPESPPSTPPPTPICSPSTQMPRANIMSPMPVSVPTASAAFPYVMSPMMMSPPVAMPLTVPMPFSTTIVSGSAMTSPFGLNSTIGPTSVISIGAPMSVSTQSTTVSRRFVIN